jgi:4-amino-4-deoxy-L-arabinose transferase-like glycosyltransferase
MGFRTFADDVPDEAPRQRKPLDRSRNPLALRSHLIIVLFAGVLLLPGLGGDLRVLTQHEVFAAETAREMLASGDWIMPRFAGVPRLNKPPGMYWLIAGSMAIFQSRAEWVARLPAALAGILLSLVVARLAARWLGDFIGLIAGLMQASSVYILMQARLGEADMPMAAAVAIAMAAFATAEALPQHPGRQRRWLLALIFGLSAGASLELKGPGLAFIFAGCVVWILATRRWQSFRFLFHPLALLVLTLTAGAWPLAIYLRDPNILRVWWHETFGRFSGEFGPPEPWHTYFVNVPWLLLPWWPYAIVAVIAWWRDAATWHGFPTRANDAAGEEHSESEMAASSEPLARVENPCHVDGGFFAQVRAHPRTTFLACWFIAGMTLLLLSSAKHKHYAIPMLPPVTIVAAAGFVRWLAAARRERRARMQTVIGLIALAIADGAGVAAVLLRVKVARVEMAISIAAIILGICVTIIAYGAAARRIVVAGAFGTALLAGLLFQFLVLPHYDDYKASAALARRANALVPQNEPILLVKLGEAHAAYYLEHPLIRIDRVQRRAIDGVEETQSPWEKFLRDSPATTLYILCPRGAIPMLAQAGEVAELDRVDHQRKAELDSTVLVRLVRTGGSPLPAAP